MNEPFAHLPPDSAPLTFPVTYGESRVASLLYLVNATQAHVRLADSGMAPLTIGDHALLSISWFDYAESALGPYRELSIGLVTDSQPSRSRSAKSALIRRFFSLGTFVL